MLFIPKEDVGSGDFAIESFVFRMHFNRAGSTISPETMSSHSNVVEVGPFLPAPILMELIPHPNPPRWSGCWAMHTVWLPNISEYRIFEEQVSNNPGFSGTVSTGRSSQGIKSDGTRYEYADHSPFWTEVFEGSPRIYVRRRTFQGTRSSSPWSNVLMLEILP